MGRMPRVAVVGLLALAAACTPAPGKPPPVVGVTPENHLWFPIAQGAKHEIGKAGFGGDPAISCESCHPSTADSFTAFSCTECHGHAQDVNDRLHLRTAGYAFESTACFTCHPAADHQVFDHAGITGDCAMCHDVDNRFAALPVPNFNHPDMRASDCSACHTTDTWKNATGAPAGDSWDPAHDVTVNALVPTYSSFSITTVSPLTQLLPMTMNHASADLPAAALSACENCHVGANQGAFFPGLLHSSLANLTLNQPNACATCHAKAMPQGFVGPTATSPARTPPTGEMKHDAVLWANGMPGTTALVSNDCGLCHASPGQGGALNWAAGRAGTSPALYHSALAAAGQPQPASCVDCHANTRPDVVLTSANATMPANQQFDHGSSFGQGDCAGCHAKSALAPFASWSGAVFHAVGSATPATCVGCHAARRPTSTVGWLNATFATAPFDYGTNSSGITHGAGLDCVACHAGPGSGQWGTNQNWATGRFTHGAGTVSGTTCIACHASQRPDLVVGAAQANTLLSFDHVNNGAGDCYGCHQATTAANTYANYFNAGTGVLPNGDWKGGVPYPGSTYASSTTQSVAVTETHLNRSGANNLVTSTSSITATLYNGMLHVAAAVPAALNAGPTGSPDNTKCWHCHTSTGTTVTSFNNGKFHSALTTYRATPAGALAPFPQPTTGCTECHAPGLPIDVVQKAGATLIPMDHAAEFNQAVVLGGKSVTKVADADCSVCHKSPGTAWTDGLFHSNIGAAQPKECVSCHYLLMADAPRADLTQTVNYAMKHKSTQLTFQGCNTCHATALSKAAMTPAAAPLWATGVFHPSLTAQPGACVDCHVPSQPLPNVSTQSTVTWPFTLGGTATNGAMWLNHGSSFVAGKDCVVCHASDAKTTGSAWNKSDPFHLPTPNVNSCRACHGLANGGGAVPGTKNNLPNGLTDTTTVTTASATTGVAGVLDQVTHNDANIGTRDCNFCHTSVGGTWAQAKFHVNFNAANPLVLNGSTGRCSNCHLNVKPGPGYAAQDHATFTGAAGSQDCSSCHSLPGTGSVGAPNWLGAAGAPSSIAVGGFNVSSPPAPAGTMQTGISSLPHPAASAGACTTCHTSSGGGKNAIGYDHASALIAANCGACHEAGSNLVGTPWNGATTVAAGGGDTRPFTLTSLIAHYGNGLTVTAPNHFYAADCSQCHLSPAGTAANTTGATYTTAWRFPHDTAKMSNPTTCLMCHTSGIPGAPPGLVGDPAAAVAITGLVPRFTATTISSVTSLAQTLPMTMLHSSTEFPAAANSACSNCHAGATASVYFPGTLHSSLANLNLAQPTACSSCHAAASPSGFVGPLATSPARIPATGEMNHDAVRWTNGVPTTTALVSTNCTACHDPPSAAVAASWAITSDGGLPRYHSSLASAGQAQPNSCLDCHANSRRTDVLTSANAVVPVGVTFDHATTQALADCTSCHAKSSTPPFASWSGGQFHLAGAANPATCVGCHAGERPTSTAGWKSLTYANSPFDYGTNAAGITHGKGLECAVCHAGPGTGAWGSTQNWQAGNFVHGVTTASGTTCIACHMAQRPDLVLGVAQANALLGFDHASDGTGDCFGCHQATVSANTYLRYYNAGTGMLPNGDWKGGVSYPGSTLVSAPNKFVTVPEITLVKTGALVTGTTTTTATLYNAMLHTSAALPAALNAGPTGSPDGTKCWHCHTHTGTTVTGFQNGAYHASLTTYSATPGGAVVPFPQPTSGCGDCHDGMLPSNIVEKAASDLQPMDHRAQFATAVVLGGQSVTAVNQADCSVCHKAPGGNWNDGLFHLNIGAATPTDCVLCHYPLMADAAKSDLTSTTLYAMKHRSTQLTFQTCQTCHTTALTRSTTASHAATLWAPGVNYHPALATQPTACNECHTVSEPAANASTQSSWAYTLPLGGTTTNGAQWNNHGATVIAGKDCVVCHAADAKVAGSAWNKVDQLHPTNATTTCAVCHGTTNGKGTVIGTNNNLPNGLTNSTMTSSVAGVASTGIPANTKAQLTHSDVNVTRFDCVTCHTQKGISAVAGITGKEWAQAKFHAQFTGATTLTMNATTGRCSNCHMNVKPIPTYPGQDHTAFTAASGSTDCSSCHSFPGNGTATAPNWQGATGGVPTYISVGGFQISQPPAASLLTQTGINNLPHPTVGTTPCATCHSGGVGGKNAIGYDHLPAALVGTNCSSCHEAGSNLLGTPWNGSTTTAGGAGNTRPFTIVGLVPSTNGNKKALVNGYQHFYPQDCKECHRNPTGIATSSTGATYTTRWKFNHTESRMTNPTTCNMCHKSPNNLPN